MFKKLAVPIFVLSMATYGCSSDSSPNPGTGGTGGGTAGSGGRGGSAGATAGTGGGTAGTGGATAGTGGGTAGTGGGAAGSGGRGGSAGATAGTGGGTAGTGGATAGTGGGTAGTGGGAAGSGGRGGSAGATAGTGGGTAGTTGGGGTGGAAPLACTVTTSTGTDVLTPQAFCQNFLANCQGVSGFTPPFSNMGDCVTAYTAYTATQQHCRSYHLCWGVEGLGGGTANPGTHCPHTVGMGACQ